MNKITRSITINETLWNNFKAICAIYGDNMSGIINVLIEEYTKKSEDLLNKKRNKKDE